MGNYFGMRGWVGLIALLGRWFSFALIIICTTLLLQMWVRTPLVGFLPLQNWLEIFSPEKNLQLAPLGLSTNYSQKRSVDDSVRPQVKEKEKNLQLAPLGLSTSYSQKRSVDDSVTPQVKEKGCNYAKGKWVADSRWSLYSGFGCKQWLSPMWACRLSPRIDFSYEYFRWKPDNCEMQAFDSSSFLKRMQDKTIAFIGDSLGREQFQSLMCMVTGGKDSPDVENFGWKYGLYKAKGAIRPDGWAYRFPTTNTTILFYWSATLCLVEPLNNTNQDTAFAMHIDRPVAFLQHYIHNFDILVLNTGHHWNRGKFEGNHWTMYAGGERIRDGQLTSIQNAKNLTIYSIVKWLDTQLHHLKLEAFFRTISPRHYLNGDWNTGGGCNNTKPLARGDTVSKDESSDPLVAGAVKGTRVRLLDVTAISELRDEGHISKHSIRAKPGVQDCLHWCLPGIPDTWNELLFSQL